MPQLQREFSILAGAPCGLFELPAAGTGISALFPDTNRSRFCTFCHELRENMASYGSNVCVDLEGLIAQKLIEDNRVTKGMEANAYSCHLGFTDFAIPICVRGRVAAVFVSGQCPPTSAAGIEATKEAIATITSLPRASTYFPGAGRDDLCRIRSKLEASLQTVNPIEPITARDAYTRSAAVADVIETMCEAYCEEHERVKGELFAAEIAEKLTNTHVSMDYLWEALRSVLNRINEFYSLCDAVFYLSEEQTPEQFVPKVVVQSQSKSDLIPYQLQVWDDLLSTRSFGAAELALRHSSALDDIIKATGFSRFVAVPMRFESRVRSLLLFGTESTALADRERLELEGLAHGVLQPYIASVLHQRERDNLLHDAFHLLRQPMGMMQDAFFGLHRNLSHLDSDKSVPIIKNVERIQDGLRFLNHTMNNVLTLATGSLEMDSDVEDVSIADILREAVETFKGIASMRDTELRLAIDPSASSATLRANRQRMSLLTSNLIDNAVKYSFRGKYVHISLTKENERGCIVKVVNFGFGILPEEQPRVFERGYRTHVRDTKRHVPGLGIGLSIVKHICNEAGAEITFSSIDCAHKYPGEAEEGEFYKTTFVLTLPGVS
jgi:signal transduction histidine kinase